MLLNAVMCVWNEEDIIESTIKHAFAQGCSNVFIIDNASTDKTVENAINAGAILAAQFESNYFNEFRKISYLNTVVKNYNNQSDAEYIWWLYIDADEFPNIDNNLTIFDFIQQLDKSIRAVHGYMLSHIPTHPPYYISSYHPIDFMQICTKSSTYKIPLLRYDKGKQHLYSVGGAHTFDTCGESIPVAKNVLNIHHFNYRRYDHTVNRLNMLCNKKSDGTSRIDLFDYRAKNQTNDINAQSEYIKRLNSVESIYKQSLYKCLMTDDIPYNYQYITRWYDYTNPNNFIQHIGLNDILLNQAIHYFFLKKYDVALCKFYDLLQIVDDQKLQLLITIKIAQCLFFSDNNEAISLLKPILKCNNIEIKDYATKQLMKFADHNILNVNNIKTMLQFNIENYCRSFDYKLYIENLS